MRTPWGESDHIEHKAPGVYFVSTPSHGGFRVESPLLDRIPREWRSVSFNNQGQNGWFEEDIDWCMVALTFPELFGEESLGAQETFDHWIKPKLAVSIGADR
jgi:hypothetical protein